MPTKMVIEYLDILLPVIVKLINGSLESRVVPKCFKTPAQKTQPWPKLYGELQACVQLAIHLQTSGACCDRATGHSTEWESSAGQVPVSLLCRLLHWDCPPMSNEWLAVQHEWWYSGAPHTSGSERSIWRHWPQSATAMTWVWKWHQRICTCLVLLLSNWVLPTSKDELRSVF